MMENAMGCNETCWPVGFLGKSPAFSEVSSKLQPPVVSLGPPESMFVHIYSLAAGNSDDIFHFILIMFLWYK